MPNPYGRDHQDERANWQDLIDNGHPVNCWRCGKPIPPRQPKAWDLGHLEDLKTGGNPKRRRPECASCNRSAGGAISRDVPPSRPW